MIRTMCASRRVLPVFSNTKGTMCASRGVLLLSCVPACLYLYRCSQVLVCVVLRVEALSRRVVLRKVAARAWPCQDARHAPADRPAIGNATCMHWAWAVARTAPSTRVETRARLVGTYVLSYTIIYFTFIYELLFYIFLKDLVAQLWFIIRRW
jgi:hypothetical protein